jgi:hypothetical protein
MRKKDVQGIVNDLFFLSDYKSPVRIAPISNKIEINLLTGKINAVEEDSVTDLLKEKRQWFKERVRKLKGKLSDFKKAKITIFGSKEKIEIEYKGEKFSHINLK